MDAGVKASPVKSMDSYYPDNQEGMSPSYFKNVYVTPPTASKECDRDSFPATLLDVSWLLFTINIGKPVKTIVDV